MAAYQTSPPLGFSRQEHWSGLPFPSPTSFLQMSLRGLGFAHSISCLLGFQSVWLRLVSILTLPVQTIPYNTTDEVTSWPLPAPTCPTGWDHLHLAIQNGQRLRCSASSSDRSEFKSSSLMNSFWSSICPWVKSRGDDNYTFFRAIGRTVSIKCSRW